MKRQITRAEAQKEVDDNLEFFEENLKEIKKQYPDKKFILLKGKKAIGGFLTFEDAKQAGELHFKEYPLYSIQEIDQIPINLGYQGLGL